NKRETQSNDTRLCQLSANDNKTSVEFKEIDLLTRQLKRLDTGQTTTTTGVKKTSRRKKKNHFSEEQIDALRSKILDSLAWHQRGWYEQRDQRNR
ncbi:oxidoreductase, partial [Klebsiella pneumoniae]|nr:oxidoreductase [Klebsiella pneumoniae]